MKHRPIGSPVILDYFSRIGGTLTYQQASSGLTQKSSEVAVIHVACLLAGITATKARAFERFLRKS